MSMQGLRNAATNFNNGNNNKGGKGGRNLFYAKWRPPQIVVGAGFGKERQTFDLHPFLAAPPSEESKVEAAEAIVIVPGAYADVYAKYPDGHPHAGTLVLPPPTVEGLHFRAHTFNVKVPPRNPTEKGFNTFRDITCSAGPEEHAPKPCIGCYEYDHGAKDSRAKDQWAFNIAHLGWYHLVPLIKDGVIQQKRDNSGPVMVKQECMSYKMENEYIRRAAASGRCPQPIARKYQECEGCKQKAEFVWGDHRLLQLGYKHLKNIFEIDDKVGKKCLGCGTGILRVAFDCEKCNAELLDLATVQWTNEQIDNYSKTPVTCNCGHSGLPKSGYECGFDDNYNQVAQPCGNSQKTTISDCVLWLQREGESTESEVVVKRVELISMYKTQDNRPLQDHLKEIVKEPFNLAEMYKADSLDDQAKTLYRQNPYAQQQQQYQSYDQQGPGPGMPPGPPAAGPGGPPAFPGMPIPGRPNYGK